VLSVDPGKMTGLAHMLRQGDDVSIIESCELDEDSVIPWVRPIIEDWRPRKTGEYPLRVVIEKFTITLETAKKSQSPFSLEVIGAVKQVCRDNDYPLAAIAWQKPSEAKGAFPNPKLKRLGLWHVGGEGHALDAIRHASLYLARSGWTDSRFSS
jgi:hypothetical protein